MKPLLERLNDEILICDGAMGTMLIQKGMPEGECPDYWGIKRHKILRSIHDEYINCGADMVITNTFGANWVKLKKYNLEKKLGEINRIAVEVAKEASAGRAYVLGEIGPTGEYLKPVGSIEAEEMLHMFTDQVKIFEESGVDAVILNTFSDMEELKTAIMAVKENVRLPLIASMTFQRLETKGFRTTSGITIPQFVNEGLLAGCDVIGANCSVTGVDMAGIVSGIRALGTAFIIAQPNAGMPRLDNGKTIYDESPDSFAKNIPEIKQALLRDYS
jgi:5-methyltetrahydrofolate--homocysteine methyltransferase